MLTNYFKIAWRNLVKSKVFSLINILGLTIGITVCMMIFLFVMNEFSVDRFHADNDRIYRVVRGYESDGQQKSVGFLSGMHAPALLNEFGTDIQKAVRVSSTGALITVGNQGFVEKKVFNADPEFFELFSFSLLKGDPATVLKDPSSIVLTESIAIKYFGNVNDAMGKIISYDKDLQLKVTGIAKDVRSDSHLNFDMVTSIAIIKDRGYMTNWINNGVFTYLLLDSKTSAQKIQSRLPHFVEKYLGSDLKKYGFKWTLFLTPLNEVYFSKVDGDNVRHGDKSIVYIFLSIAALILLIACINFMNLSTIRAVDRSKEVGLRKVVGALRNNLVWQFIGESVLLTFISCIASIGLLIITLPMLDELLGYSLTVSWNTPPIYLFLITVIIIVGLLAGSYPAFFLSSFSPIQALKGKLKLGKGGAAFRQGLVVIQFSISIFLIVGTIIIARQMNFVKNKQLGYEQEQTVAVRIDNNDIYRNSKTFKSVLQNHAAVQSVSIMSGEPGGFFDGYIFDVEDHQEKWNARTEFTDFEFVKTLGLKIIAGRNFSSSFPTDTTDAVLINRTASVKLGWTPEESIGKWIQNTVQDKSKRRIIGVVEDFNFQSLKQSIEPLVISPGDDTRVALVRLKPGNIRTGLDAIENAYKKLVAAYPFAYTFLNQKFDDMYKKDIRQQTILSVFAVLAIFVACLGLFGLTSFTATKRFKEIGVRKVLGSSVKEIVMLLSKDLLKPVLIAACIALPVGYWVMNQWLQNFEFKTNLSWWIFGLAALITFCIAFITVSVKSIKAALANPIKSLRSE